MYIKNYNNYFTLITDKHKIKLNLRGDQTMAAVPPVSTPPQSPNPRSSRPKATPDNQLRAAAAGKRVFGSPPQAARIIRGMMAPTPAGKRRQGMAPLGNRIVHRPSFPGANKMVRKPPSPSFPGANLTVETPLSPFPIPNAPFLPAQSTMMAKPLGTLLNNLKGVRAAGHILLPCYLQMPFAQEKTSP